MFNVGELKINLIRVVQLCFFLLNMIGNDKNVVMLEGNKVMLCVQCFGNFKFRFCYYYVLSFCYLD